MANSRSRRSPSPVAGGNLASSRASSSERSPGQRRSTSVRLTRRSSAGPTGSGGSRLTARTSAGSRLNISSSSSRARTPSSSVMRQTTTSRLPRATTTRTAGSSSQQNSDNSTSPAPTEDELNQLDGVASLSQRRANRNSSRERISRRPARSNRPRQQLSWYERLMPECLLAMSSPITGYETRLESDVDDDEFEILERDRLKRNKRVRRRLVTLVLLAAAASAFMYYQGRLFRRVGVKATMHGLKQRLSNMESGLEKSIQETMGK